jgi:hypothetical protein
VDGDGSDGGECGDDVVTVRRERQSRPARCLACRLLLFVPLSLSGASGARPMIAVRAKPHTL